MRESERKTAILSNVRDRARVADWPESERPRERLLRHGALALTDAELVALFLRTGTPGRDVVDLARECLRVFGGLRGLFDASVSRFCAIDGLGVARFAQLQATAEMLRRALAETLRERPLFDSPQTVRDYLRLTLGSRQQEVFVALFVDAQHRLVASEELFRGTLAQTSVYPREVVKRALATNAAAVVFAHNHPSGVAEPSRADEVLTQALRAALELVDIRTLDHFIVAGSQVYGFVEHGKL